MAPGESETQTLTKRRVFKSPPNLTPDQFIEKIIELRPLIQEQQELADEKGGYTQPVHDALVALGAYGVLQPKRYGGHEFDVTTLLRATIEIARSDPGTAWCYCFAAAHVLMLASHYDEQAQDEIFGLNDGLALAPLRAPTNGTIRQVEGGYVVNGAWDYASGVPYATHAMPTARLIGSGEEGPPTFLMPVIRADQFKILPDSWGRDLTLGLRASGSHTFVVEDAFVPDHMVAPFYEFQRAGENLEPTYGVRLHRNPMYLGLTTSFFGAVIACVMVGAGWAALDEFERILRTKKTINPPFHERFKSHEFQGTFGEALMEIRGAEVMGLEVGRAYMAACQRWSEGQIYSAAEDFLAGGLATQAGLTACQAIEKIFYAGGSTGAKKGERLNRYFRDMATYRTHPIAQYRTAAEALAQAHFGLPVPMLEAVGGARSERRR